MINFVANEKSYDSYLDFGRNSNLNEIIKISLVWK